MMKMKTLALLSLTIAVALGMPSFVPEELQNNVLDEEKQSPQLKDLLPAQGHVVVDDPVSQVLSGSMENPEKLSMVPVDMEQSQYIVEPAVNIKPEVGVEQEGDVKMEVEENKPEAQLKPEPDFEGETEIKKEQEGKDIQEVKAEQEVKAKPEVMPVLELKLESKGPLDVEDDEANVQTEDNAKADIEMDLMDDSAGNVAVVDSVPQVQPDSIEQPEGWAMVPDFMNESEVEVETEDKSDSDANVESEVKLNSEVKGEVDENEGPEGEMELKLEGYPDFKVESEVKVELDEEENEPEMKAMSDEVQENFQMEMSLEEEPESGPELSHIEMEDTQEMIGEPVMELEPLDDEQFQLQRSLEGEPESGQGLKERLIEMVGKQTMIGGPMMEMELIDDDYLFENKLSKKAELSEKIREVSPIEQNLELDPEMKPEEVVADVAIMEEGAALDSLGQSMLSLEEYFPNEEARMGMEQASHIVAESDYLMMEEPRATRRSSCPGVVLNGKCYRFFGYPKNASDAEFNCQLSFPGGHLASITSPIIHRELINLIIKQNGSLTRTWVGGLRYLKTGRFIWLDGSHWSYADWLSGEPNNTQDKEDCVEVLHFGNGKFNDFTCWEPQAYICSYPLQ